MGSDLATVIVEARLLVRKALKSLMAQNSYRVVCDFGSTAEISAAAVFDEPKLVILGAQFADNAVTEALAIRKLWPDSKIILLYEQADFQKLRTSEINGCVPMSASPDTLIGMLDLIVIRNAQVMVVPSAKCPAIQPAQPEKSHQSDIKLDKLQASLSIRAMHTKSPVNGARTDPNLWNRDTQCVPALRNHRQLSEREVQILNGLVKGHANKVIARTCEITEATVKVHMRSILRKIRVGNRTQAAIWARENGYAAPDFKGPPLETDLE
jgi:two-component system nitrate/nitrite response regulator NarL